MITSHLTILESSALRYASSPAFKIPHLSGSKACIEEWRSITYEQFHNDVQLFARHWHRRLQSAGIPQRSIIGLWLTGFAYVDILHIYGVSRAGFIPQLFSIRLPNPAVIYELLEKAGARALIFDPASESLLTDCPLPAFPVVETGLLDVVGEPLPEMLDVNMKDTVFVFHTSGSTSGSPKLVPCNYQWLDTTIEKSRQICRPRDTGRQDVTVAIGSLCHIAQTFMLIGALQYGSCVVQPTAQAFPPEELVDMVVRCGLNRLNQFGSFLTNTLRRSRMNPKLLSMLTNLDDILYTGVPLPHEEEAWAYQNGMKLRNLFGNTECGGMLLSIGGCDETASYLRPLEGFSYRFDPIASAQAEAAYQSTGQLFELVVLADSPDCPDPSLRHSDGHFHTGDLFQKVSSGFFVSRGRDDDWIKSENSLRCDTKAIEDNVRAMCGDLIAECIVVGSGRPSPVVFVEATGEREEVKLKKEIIRKTRHFHSRRYLHERITSVDMIVVVPCKSLPRTSTKGNIRRKAVEEQYAALLDQIFSRTR